MRNITLFNCYYYNLLQIDFSILLKLLRSKFYFKIIIKIGILTPIDTVNSYYNKKK